MIECLPVSLCSWNYVVRGDGHTAQVDFNWTSEQGAITIGGTRLEVRKHGFASGRWTAELGGEVLAEAHKPSSMSRSFNVQSFTGRSPAGPLLLEADSAFSNRFGLHAGGARIATLRTKHVMTRRALIERHAVGSAASNSAAGDGAAVDMAAGDGVAVDEAIGEPDFATLCFCFWLAALTWKRASERSN
ncbi:MAG: hypothetical protein AAGG46_11185 [Planctomycetota bacterium]